MNRRMRHRSSSKNRGGNIPDKREEGNEPCKATHPGALGMAKRASYMLSYEPCMIDILARNLRPRVGNGSVMLEALEGPMRADQKTRCSHHQGSQGRGNGPYNQDLQGTHERFLTQTFRQWFFLDSLQMSQAM
ncbi:hypothetical protein VNO77_02673 [Canavalia gladiata]|uniref:Uncharacterized protein n=1 Tax=Canavalia gladiata TaxID=3824 RepID=A0AAN9R7F6_CANGL